MSAFTSAATDNLKVVAALPSAVTVGPLPMGRTWSESETPSRASTLAGFKLQAQTRGTSSESDCFFFGCLLRLQVRLAHKHEPLALTFDSCAAAVVITGTANGASAHRPLQLSPPLQPEQLERMMA